MSTTPTRRAEPADDLLHPPRAGDPDWAETVWFAAAVPERGLGIWTYPLFRTSLGVVSCNVFVWGPGAEELWEQPYYRNHWHMPIAPDLDLRSFTLPNSLSYTCEEPLRRYHVRYDDPGALQIDLSYEALHEAHPFGLTKDYGHLDQLCHVQGEIVLHGERIPVDCVEIRDRTWSPRREGRDRTFLTYSYGATHEGRGFHCSTRFHKERGQEIMTGFLLNDGETVDLRHAARHTERDGKGRPERFVLELEAVDGRSLEVRGEVISRMAMYTTPYFAWISLVRWTLPDGTIAYGEDQDVWSPGALRAFRATGLTGTPGA